MKRIRQSDQKGMVAIIVTMIMIFVITLIILGFSEVTRRNQREALDSQLGTQAYYAAESGVNLVSRLLSSGTPIPSNDNCTNFSSGGVSIPRTLSANHGVANTCLMVNANPTSMLVDHIAQSTDTTVWDVKDSDTTATFTTLQFEWQPSGAGGSCTAAVGKYLKPSSTTCKYALLRVDIFNPAANGGATDSATLAANTKTVYLQPGTGGQTAVLGATAASQGLCMPSATSCKVNIDVSGFAANEYYVRLTTLYATANNVKLTAGDSVDSTVGTTHFANGQVVVDSTGRAQDQLKRIQVRIPSGGPAKLPVFALQSANTICKNLAVKDAPVLYDKGACTPLW